VIQALKSYGTATVVGTRTWGGVRGVDFKYTLVDGTLAAQPKYAWWLALEHRPPAAPPTI
jgi:tricorn protease